MHGKKSINDALKEYIGFGTLLSPRSDVAALVNNYDFEINKKIFEILEELDTVQVDWNKFDLEHAAEFAVGEVFKKFTFLDEDSKKALAWKFTFDWR